MKQALNILHVEDSKEDSELIRSLLGRNGFECEVTRVDTRPGVFDALEKNSYDIILADCKLPGFSGLGALEIAHALKPETPFIFVSGTIGEETAIQSLRDGATDYVLKDRLSRLVPAIHRALAEAEERTMCRQLQQRLHEAGRLEAIGTLSDGIAHDFNNILTIILGHASLLTMESENPSRVLEISGTITDAAQRGSEIVQQLLAFARKSDGHVTLADLNGYIQAHLNAFREKLTPWVNLSFEPGANLPDILMDPSQLDRMVSNLISNSVEAMAGGGRIVLSTRRVSAAEIPEVLPESVSETYVSLTVTDTGKGIDSSTREHVFEPFFTTKERGRGTGLGLPVVYGLMKAHRGYVDVKSEMGEGTAVSLFFPVPKANEVKQRPTAHSSDPALNGSETILVVEAAHCDQALKVFRDHQNEIELVFSDIGLPKVDGIALCEKLRALKPGLRLILASGYPTKEFKERINALGAPVFLSKPYSTREILKVVRSLLDGARA